MKLDYSVHGVLGGQNVYVSVSPMGKLSMNDLPVIRDLRYAQWILGSPGGKHCKSLERNVWRKVVSSSKAVIFNKE